MQKIIETGIKKYFQLRKYKFESWKKNALASQDFILFDLLNTAGNTQFGQEHDFEHITSYKKFKDTIPVSTYENIYPYIEKMLNGEQNILWPGFIQFFSKSSGTTNDVSKYIPVSHNALYKNNYSAGKDVYTIFFNNYKNSNLLENHGSVLSLGGSISQPNEKGIQIGDVSAIIMSQLPKWAGEYREPSIEVALMEHWKDKIPAIINDLKGKNITQISGIPTWFVSLFDEIKKQNPNISLAEMFPNMELFVHGAVAFEPYRALFEDFFPSENMKYLEVYNATEGFFAIQDIPEKKGEMLLLTDHGIFYEFISMDQYGTNNPKVIKLDDVVAGVDYAMIVTTNAGLWRYDIGDTICFTSLEPYRIKISGRTKHFINVFGEELMVGNADSAISEVSKKHNVSIENYTAGPVFMDEHGKGGHEWLIEFKTGAVDISTFAIDLDDSLKKLNSDYRAKRQDDIALQLPIVHSIFAGTFEKWMESRGKLGAQNKVPRLSNKRDYIESLLEI